MSPPADGVRHKVHALVEKWDTKDMERIQRKHGVRRYEREDLLALGYLPTEVTDDTVEEE